MNVIPCATWVRRGVAAAIPDKVELTSTELESIIKQTQAELDDAESDSDEERNAGTSMQTDNQKPQFSASNDDEYNFEKYDEESENIHCHIKNIATFGNGGRDPLVTRDIDDSEEEDDIIKTDDNLVLVGHVEGDASILEVFVYNEAEGSFYCHHDILLPSFPLCIEWLNFDPEDPKPNNMCAIGNMTPIIEVWDLDLIDCLEPAYRLGCKASKKKKTKQVGHKDAVLDLAWNENYVHILASGSVDQTVLLWDLQNGTPVNTLNSFNEKVQSLKWNPRATHQLLTGCADKYARLFDCRQETITNTWEASGEIERVLWNSFDTNYCITSTDTGYIQYVDIRTDKSVWNIKAHEKEITGLSLSSACPGLLVSSSNDGIIKVWDIINNAEPTAVWEKKSNLGALQCLSSNPNSPFVFAVGGDNKTHNFKVIDFLEIPEVRDKFQDRKCNAFNSVQVEKEEVMDVSEDMESMILNPSTSDSVVKRRKKSKK